MGRAPVLSPRAQKHLRTQSGICRDIVRSLPAYGSLLDVCESADRDVELTGCVSEATIVRLRTVLSNEVTA